MWKCPRCGREFTKTNQSHYCGDIPINIDAYIAAQPEDVQSILVKVREAIRTAAPDAVERISWNMPTFYQGENLIHFCVHKKHLGIYPGALDRFPDDLTKRLSVYKTTKGAIQLPYDKPIDYELIADIARWRVAIVEGAQNGG